MLHALAAMHLTVMADSSSAGSIMRSYVSPVVRSMCVLASLVCVFFLVNGGISYMTSAGKPEQLENLRMKAMRLGIRADIVNNFLRILGIEG